MDGAPAVTSLVNAHGSRNVIMKKMQEVTSRRQALQILSGGAVTIALSSVNSGGAFAQEYPTKPVTVIIPYTAGGSTEADTRPYTIKLSEAATAFLVDHGHDEHYGARPLKRAIQRYIEDPLSEKILLGEFSKGDEIEVEVSTTEKEKLEFRVLSPAPQA